MTFHALAASRDLITLRALAGLSRDAAARLCSVSARTWHRWEQHQTRAPGAAVVLLQWKASGIPGAPGWPGWHFHPKTGELISPAGQSFTPGDLEALALSRLQGGEPYPLRGTGRGTRAA